MTILQSNLSLACRKWKQFGLSHAWMEAVWRRHAKAAEGCVSVKGFYCGGGNAVICGGCLFVA